jgi:hypothetical protein
MWVLVHPGRTEGEIYKVLLPGKDGKGISEIWKLLWD